VSISRPSEWDWAIIVLVTCTATILWICGGSWRELALLAEPPQPVEPVKPKPRRPAPVPESAMPEVARSWLKNYLEGTLWNAPSIERVKVRIGEVLRQPADPKKVAWLWHATASVSITKKPVKPEHAAEHLVTSWQLAFRLTPNREGGECWREVADMYSGTKTRKNFGESEWRPDFRQKVLATWGRQYPDWDAEMVKTHVEPKDRKVLLWYFKDRISKSLDISIQDLEDILESTS
jgi:hypothetical protein